MLPGAAPSGSEREFLLVAVASLRNTGSGRAGFSSCGPRASLLHRWDLQGPGVELATSALAGGSLLAAAPGRSSACQMTRQMSALWTLPHRSPLSLGFFTQEYLGGGPFPARGQLPAPGITAASLEAPAWAGGFFTTSATWEARLDKWSDVKGGVTFLVSKPS